MQTVNVLVWGTAEQGACAPPTDLAWAAGFLDGEGCVQVASAGRGNRTLVLRLSAPQVTRAPLARLQSMFGGGLYVRAKGRRDMRPQWVWEVTSHRAARTLAMLLPYLMVKRAEARLAIQFIQWRASHVRPGRAQSPWDLAEGDSFRLALQDAHHLTEGGDAL